MWHYKILKTGFFYADGGAMFGAIPKQIWSRKYPVMEENLCELAMNCLLAWNDERVVVLDTGLGTKDLDQLSYYRFHDLADIAERVREAGFQPEQVTDVVLSHLHFDHCGGCTWRDADGKLQLTFPKALHWIGERQWENFLCPNDLESASFRPDDILPIADAGLLQLVEENFVDLDDHFRLYIYKGHTMGQLVSFFKSKEGDCVFTGDVIPTRAHLPADWISAYDTHPLHSLAAKNRLKAKMERRRSRLFFYHDAYQPFIQFPSR